VAIAHRAGESRIDALIAFPEPPNRSKDEHFHRVRRESGGGAKGIRTPDLLNAIEALYQLSYDPTCEGGRDSPRVTPCKRNFAGPRGRANHIRGVRSSQLSKKHRGVISRFHLAMDRSDLPFRIDDKRAALGTHILATVHALLNPDAVRFHNGPVFIDQQREGKNVFLDEFRMASGAIDTHPEYDSLPGKLLPYVPQAARLRGAARRIVLRVEIQNDDLSPKILKRDALAIVRSPDCEGAEFRCRIAGLKV
jgi:hypothetical protein